MNPRAAAAKILTNVIHNKETLTVALKQLPLEYPSRSLIQELCYGVCRYYFTLKAMEKKLLAKPIKDKETIVSMLLLMGFYQCLWMRVPDHAAVAETVNAARALKKDWAVKLINGVLRQFLREKDAFQKLSTDENFFAHPPWLTQKIKQAWPNHWQTILSANNEHPPLWCRVNLQKISRDQYLQQCQQQKLDAYPAKENNTAVRFEKPLPVSEIPGFLQGECTVQDISAQFAAPLLDLHPGQRVLDACAAPGGKTTHLWEQEPQLESLVAVDKDKQRLANIVENCQRLHCQVKVRCADITEPKAWWDGRLFHRILCDAPCSATGVIRRHPDIKVLRKEKDLKTLVKIQKKCLTALWPLLEPEGLLLYVTCSMLPGENNQLVADFLNAHADATEIKIHAPWGHALNHGRQILPGEHGGDGFYYCLLKKSFKSPK